MFKNKMLPNLNSTQSFGGAQNTKMLSVPALAQLSWTTIAIYVSLIIGLTFVAYYLYKQFTNASSIAFKPNREHVPVGSIPSGQAELMLFYVDWCPHCKTAKPEWENLKSAYENKQINGYNIIFTEYNCTNESAEVEQLMDKYKIEGYPTIKLLKDNQIIEYDAKPTKATMEQFLNTVL